MNSKLQRYGYLMLGYVMVPVFALWYTVSIPVVETWVALRRLPRQILSGICVHVRRDWRDMKRMRLWASMTPEEWQDFLHWEVWDWTGLPRPREVTVREDRGSA